MTERLLTCAIIRGGIQESGDIGGTHADIRRRLGDENPYEPKRGDVEGFLTTDRRFVHRLEAAAVAFAAGQSTISMRELLSSDIDWDGRKAPAKPPGRGRLYGKPHKRPRF